MRGGKRANSGRKVGAATAKTRAIADQAISEGITPLEVMLHNMREMHKAACNPTDGFSVLEQIAARGAAVDAAHKAAPFVHPRLANIEHKGEDGGPIKVTFVRYSDKAIR